MPIQVVEAYKNYVPPIDAIGVAELLLNYVPQEYHRELAEVVLTNSAALSRQQRRGRVRSGSRITQVRGLYYEPWNGRLARIEIFVDKTLDNCPPLLLKLPIMRSFIFSEVLYHEMGHHMQFLYGKSSGRQQEKLAEQYERKLFDMFIEQRYWYVWPFIATIRWARKVTARRFMRKIGTG